MPLAGSVGRRRLGHTGGFRFQVGEGEQEADRLGDVFLGDFHDVPHAALEDLPVVFAQAESPGTVGDRLRFALILHDRARPERLRGVIGRRCRPKTLGLWPVVMACRFGVEDATLRACLRASDDFLDNRSTDANQVSSIFRRRHAERPGRHRGYAP